MSDTVNDMNGARTVEGRDPASGRFLAGNTGNGGRKKGSRNKLGEAFLSDVLEERSGPECLRAMVKTDPASFCRLVGNILPKELDATLNVHTDLFAETKTFLEAFRLARAYLADMDKDEEPALIELEHEPVND